MNNDNVIYTVEYDETIPTRERDGVVEHKHIGFDYWHPVSRKHDGCGRTDDGDEYDVRMCVFCEYVDDASLCHGRRRALGLTMASVAHYVSGLERINIGIDEHIHDGYKRWHSVDVLHFGCRRVENGVVKDSILCSTCAGFYDNHECHNIYDMRKMTEVDYFSHKSFAIAAGYPKCIDRTETILIIDEAVTDLVIVKSMLDRVGKDSEHVQQVRFEQFVRTIDGIVDDLLKISRYTEEEIEAERKRMEADKNGSLQ